MQFYLCFLGNRKGSACQLALDKSSKNFVFQCFFSQLAAYIPVSVSLGKPLYFAVFGCYQRILSKTYAHFVQPLCKTRFICIEQCIY